MSEEAAKEAMSEAATSEGAAQEATSEEAAKEAASEAAAKEETSEEAAKGPTSEEAAKEATSEAAAKEATSEAAQEASSEVAAKEATSEAGQEEKPEAAAKKCTRCGVETTSVWRRDRVTEERICNKCYREVWVLPYREAIAEARKLLEAEAKVEKPPEEKKAEKPPEERKAEKPPEEKKAPEAAAKKASSSSNGEESRKRSRELTRELSRTASDGADPVASEQSPPAALDLATPDVETDTEYAEADLSEAPIKLIVLHSGSDKTDGTYWLMAKGSRGKPCFAKWAEKRTTFLYWNKKWILGWVFGSVKSNAHLKDVPGLSVPCEPYPRTWKVLEKRDKHAEGATDDDKRHYLDNPAMRVIDGSFEDMALEDERLGRQVPFEGHKLREKRSIESKRKRKVVADGETLARRSQDAAGPEDSSEDSDSDSTESSSSSAPAPKAKAAKAAKAEPKEAAPKSASAPQDFEQKLRSELLKVTTHAARLQKWESVKEILQKRAAGETGGPERMKALFAKIQAWLMELADDAAKKSKKSPGSKTKTADGGKKKFTGGHHEPDKNLPRAPAILRKSGGARRTKPITFSDAAKSGTLVKEELVASYRTLGESLWYTQPGALVICDSCEKEVLQSMGTLQGAGNRSQFAQNTFLCSSCQGA